LVEAFKSTLSELQYAHLLLHVVDISDLNWENHIQVVQHIIEDLNVDKPMLYVFNKVDKVTMTPALYEVIAQYQPFVLVSSLTQQGLQPLIEYLATWQKDNQKF
jgi:GTP-binding protein HflX